MIRDKMANTNARESLKHSHVCLKGIFLLCFFKIIPLSFRTKARRCKRLRSCLYDVDIPLEWNISPE